MPGMAVTLILILIFIVALVALAGVFLPVGEIVSRLGFKFLPHSAKSAHFFRLRNPNSNTLIYLLGTIHGGHFARATAYPYYALLSALQNTKPNLLLVEIRPQAFAQGLWGEGPPEMPYAVSMAHKMNIPVTGMDYWRPDYTPARDFDDREDHMAKLIVESAKAGQTTLIFAGFSHVRGLKRRLVENGFSIDKSFGKNQKLAVLATEVPHDIPRDYVDAVSKVIDRVKLHQSDYSNEWAENRRILLAELEQRQLVKRHE